MVNKVPDKSQLPTETVIIEGASSTSQGIAPLFSAGERLAGRFEICRHLGQGGMGQVFEALDHELGERVALKIIRPDRSARTGLLERFKREVQLARQVTHGNVCRIFDLFVHTGDDAARWGAARPPIFFLTMERLRGETLSERLRGHGPLPPRRALPIISQIAAGLDAAHRAQVVHRDFKSTNVILVDDGGRTRAVVTDFGLAAVSGDGSEPGGTPRYAAPEQLAGEETTAAADIYAFGVVIHEMVTGRLPESCGRATTMAFEGKLPSAWRSTIGRCLEPRPEDRFSTAGAVARRLAPRRMRRWRMAGALGAALGTILVVIDSARRPPPEIGAVRGRPSVAVLGFSGPSSDGWIAPSLAELLTHQLAAGDTLRAFTGEQVATMRAELGLEVGEVGEVELMRRAGTLLGADYLITGACAVDGREISLELRLTGRDGEELARWTVEGTEESLAAMATSAGEEARRRLGAGDGGRADPILAADPAALRPFAAGLERLRVLDGAGAVVRLREAAERAPRSPWAWSALARAYALAGADEPAASAARTAVARSAGLPREPRLRLEAQMSEAEKDWEKARQLYRTLWTLYPDNLEHGLHLAAVESASGDPDDALATIEELRRRAAPRNDPRIDLAEAEAAQARGDLQRQLAAARRALAGARAAGTEAMAGRALLVEAHALDSLGLRAEARKAAAEAGHLFEARGDRRAQAHAVLALAEQRMREPQAAMGMTVGATLETFRRAGDRRGEARVRVMLARSALHEGRLEESRRQIDSGLQIAREVGSRLAEAEALNMLALYHWTVEDLELALPAFEEALEAARASGNLRLVAGILGNLGRTQNLLALHRAARASYEEATAITQRTGSRFVHGLNTLSLGRLALAQGDLATAATLCKEAAAAAATTQNAVLRDHATSLETGILFLGGATDRALAAAEEVVAASRARGVEGETLIGHELGVVGMLMGVQRWSDAEARLRAIVAALPLEEHSAHSMSARLQLASALAAQGKTAEAHRLVAALTPFLGATEEVSLRFDRSAVLAEIDIAEGRPAEAILELETLLEDPRLAFVRRLSLRLQLARALAAGGGPATAQATLEAVRLAAETAGYHHFVQRVEAELARLSHHAGPPPG